MILVDANLLLYAYLSQSEHHRAARQWIEATFSGTRPVRLAWVTILAFLRVSTHARLSGQPLAMRDAARVVGEWLDRPSLGVLSPGERHWSILSGLLAEAQVRGALTTDAHLAALAIEYGATLCTCDKDFTRFRGLNLLNPLEG